MNQKKFSKTGLALVASMLICLLICLAVLLPKGGLGGSEAEDLNDADTPDLKTVMNEGTPVLIYDKRPEAQALVAAYENGTMEKLFKNIVVAADAETASAGDDTDDSDDGEAKIDLAFRVEDGAPCEYTLIGDSALTIGDEDYRVIGAEALVKYLNTLK